MELKRIREGIPYVDPPSKCWVSHHVKTAKDMKTLVPSPLEADRATACGKGRIADWFERMEVDLAPET